MLSFKDIKLCTEMHKHMYAQFQPSINTDFTIRCFDGGILPIFFSSWETWGKKNTIALYKRTVFLASL